jgi:hypothetical protein
MVETFNINATIPMVRKAAMCAYRTEGPQPSLYKDFSVFVEMVKLWLERDKAHHDFRQLPNRCMYEYRPQGSQYTQHTSG